MDFIDQLIKNYKPEKIILFGSRAWGEPDDESDVDLLIIKITNTRRLNRREEALSNIERDVPVDVIILTPDEINYLVNEMRSEFIKEILQKGKVLYEKN